MSWTGIWVVAAVPPDAVARHRQQLGASASVRLRQRLGGAEEAENSPAMAWWRANVGRAFFTDERGWPRPTDAAHKLADLVETGLPSEDVRSEAMDMLAAISREDVVTVAARKADPATALCYALGPDAATQLSGYFGNFALAPDRVGLAARRAADLLDTTSARHDQVAARMREWLTGMGDEPSIDSGSLVAELVRVLRDAERRHFGAVGVTLRF